MPSVQFNPSEIQRIPTILHPLTQEFPIVFDNYLEYQFSPPLRGKIDAIDLYFDNNLIPAVSLFEGKVTANPDTSQPRALTVFVNDECVYLQVEDMVLLNRVKGRGLMKHLDV
jgi:hypothetical protein